MTKINYFFTTIIGILFSVLSAQVTLSIESAEINAGDTFSVDVSMDNPDDVIGGFQFILNDFPDQLDLINVEATERTEHMMTNFEPSSNVVITFDLTGIGLAMGSGPILTITLESNSIYTNSINLSFLDYFVSDLNANEVSVVTSGAVIEVSGEEPPPIFPPTELTAVGGYQSVNLAWSHPDESTVHGYRIYQEGINIGNSELPNFNATGLETLFEYDIISCIFPKAVRK